MKKNIVLVCSAAFIVLGIAVAIQTTRQKSSVGGYPGPGVTASQSEASARPEAAQTFGRVRPRTADAAPQDALPAPEASQRMQLRTALPVETNPSSAALFAQAIETLVSPQVSFGDKQAAWKQLRDSGKLDPAIKELERRMGEEPNSAAVPAALGQAYLQKCGTIQDLREQGILGMKADQVFEAALNLDPSNWEARFTKAMAMSYWPTQMNRGNEVMEQFAMLVTQQEAQTPQPHFAQSYLWLGKEYEKYGHFDYAKDIWKRGAALFPENQELRARLQGN